jgi:hypothetical protein
MSNEEISVDLTDEQYDKLWEDSKARELIGEILSAALYKLAVKSAEQDKLFWGVVYRLVGVSNKTHQCIVDWVNRKIIAKPKEKS